MIGQKQPLTEKQVKILKKILKSENNFRDLCLFCVQLDTMLRSSDLLKLKIKDLTDSKGQIKNQFYIKQQKTGEQHLVQLQEDTQGFLKGFIAESGKGDENYIFTGRKKTGKPISHNQHTLLIKKWVDLLGLDCSEFSTHSLRRTKASIIYEKTNNIEVCRQLLGHKSVASTSCYLNISKKKALEVAGQFVL